MRAGTKDHKNLFCRSFLSAHRSYQPEELPWPDLEARHVDLLRALPVWSDALRDEEGAGGFLATFADQVTDPIIREAIALQAFEEQRHGRTLRFMLDRYGVDIPEYEPKATPSDPETAFVRFGFIECTDSFAGFGFFEVVRQSRFFPDEFLSIFDRFLDEEAQHVVFFVNWLVYRHGLDWFRSRIWAPALGYGYAIARLAGAAGTGQGGHQGYVPAGADEIIADLTPARFVGACLSEYERRMSRIPDDLLRPRLLPTVSRALLPALRLWRRREVGRSGPTPYGAA